MLHQLLLVLACGSDPEPAAAPTPEAEVEAPEPAAADEALVEALEEVTAEEEEPLDEELLDEEQPDEEVDADEGDEASEVALLPPISELAPEDFGTVEAIVHEASGAVTGVRVTLAANLFVRDVPCKEARTLEAHADGRWSCVLSDPHTFGDFALRRGARAELHPNGSLSEVLLGDLASPAESVTVAGVPCLSAASLHANGTVAGCTLARGNRFGEVLLPRGSKVKLRDDGGLIRAEVYEDVPIRGSTYAAGTLLFDGSGGVSGHQVGVFGS